MDLRVEEQEEQTVKENEGVTLGHTVHSPGGGEGRQAPIAQLLNKKKSTV